MASDFGQMRTWNDGGNSTPFRAGEQTAQPAVWTDASDRLRQTVYTAPPSPSEGPITGRAHYGGVAPLALDATRPPGTPTMAERRNAAAAPSGPFEYLDYYDYSVSNNRQSSQDIYQELSNTVNSVGGDLGHDSFMRIVNEGARTDISNDVSLVKFYQDFMKQHEDNADPLLRMHTNAALETALGNYWLEHGAIIDPRKDDPDGRVFAGLGIDIGGHAAGYFFAADRNLYDAQKYLAANGMAPSAELQKSREYVHQQLVSIFGPHDIPSAMQTIETAYRQHIFEMTHFQVDLGRHVRAMPVRSPGEIKVAAKGCRDLALVDMSIADYKAQHGDGMGAQIMFKEATDFIKTSSRLDPANADVVAMRQIATRLGPAIDEAARKQNSNWFNNPFHVDS